MFDLGQVTARSSLPFLAELNEKPIAAGVLSIHKDVALLVGAATVPEGRRQGAQLVLLNSRLRYAAEQGCNRDDLRSARQRVAAKRRKTWFPYCLHAY